eukprot:TRINITY_DN11197_c0_g2_i1.p1 TRINITY_DN11197_c0_g2~~TRINITY_DN11197_c0_g2_i1.p1  ORF type:complete len:557 (-),score=96.55 TRINITY_DN11197_c0_g2_i1:332-2002(-)
MALRVVVFALGGLVSYATADKALIMQPPAGKIGDPAAWIVLPGAQIDMDTYKPLAQAIQNKASMPLWVAVLGTYLTPSVIPPEIGARVDYVLTTMQSQGLDVDKVKLFYGGHSLGSVFIQDHLYSNHGSSGPMGGKVQVLGQVLMGGFIQRKYTYPSWTYPVSTLTVGGELDGLARPTRIAEAFYHAKDRLSEFPVAVVKGMTHMQFASGEPPALVKLRDLQPEISDEQAYDAVADLVAPYFEKLSGGSDSGLLSSSLGDTAQFVAPIIKAYEMEGNRWFNAPDQIGGPGAKNCKKGGCPSKSNWAPEAQKVISEVDGWALSLENEYVDCSSTPLTGEEFHLPVISNNTQDKSLHITTYSQGYWDDAQPSWFAWKSIFDKFDTGFVATSAEELGTKLASRQCTLIQGVGQVDTPFTVDDPQFCAITNKKAYEWAQAQAAPASLARFTKYGQKYVFSDDIPKSGGPLFLDAHLQFNDQTDASGEKVVEVKAPMQKTEIDYWKKHFGPIPRPSAVPDPGCFHYCKLLSPARAMEWIYVDSLRLKRGLSAAPSTETVIV